MGIIGKAISFIVIFVLVSGLFITLGFAMELKEENTRLKEESKNTLDQPLLLVTLSEWAENIDNSNEQIFDYWIYNFGNVEAKEVIVRCDITDASEKVLNTEKFNIGNIASKSTTFEESIMTFTSGRMDTFGRCSIESAAGDYINLETQLKD